MKMAYLFFKKKPENLLGIKKNDMPGGGGTCLKSNYSG